MNIATIDREMATPHWLTQALHEVGRKASEMGRDLSLWVYLVAPKLKDKLGWNNLVAHYLIEKATGRSPKQRDITAWLKWGVPLYRPQDGCVGVWDERHPKVGVVIGRYHDKIAVICGFDDRIGVKLVEESRFCAFRWADEWFLPPFELSDLDDKECEKWLKPNKVN